MKRILFFLSDFRTKRADQLNILGVFLRCISGPLLGLFLENNPLWILAGERLN